MPDVNDRLPQYYAEKLWELIPPFYRDEDRSGVLRALVEVLAGQAAVLRHSTDRLWDDVFIDLCDGWAVPYLGDLVGTRMVSALDTRSRRTDVANTIYYRRRAGTPAVLEGLTADITGWEGTVVEEFRQLVRMPHGLDTAPAATGRLTAAPAHGLPDLRRPRGARLAYGAWDEYAHLPDTRRHRGGIDGRYGITKLAFHLYRLSAFAVLRAAPRLLAADSGGRRRFTFDPSGRTVALFATSSRPDFTHGWRRALEWELPAPISCEVLGHAEYLITEADILAWTADSTTTVAQAGVLRLVRGVPLAGEAALRTRLAALFAAAAVSPPGVVAMRRILADAIIADCGKATLLPTAGDAGADRWSIMVEAHPGAGTPAPVAQEVTTAGNLAGGSVNPPDTVLVIDAENGLGVFSSGTQPATIRVSYAYGFAGPIGAGSYRRDGLPTVPATARLGGGGAVAAPATGPDAAISIVDSLRYGPVADLNAGPRLLLQADGEQRPYVELDADLVITADGPDSELTLDGWWLGSRGPHVIRLAAAAGANWSSVRIAHCTLDPGGPDADGAALGPVTLSIESSVSALVLDACITGPVTVAATGFVRTLTATDSIIHTIDPATVPEALRQPDGELRIRGCTVIGDVAARQIEASELLCTGRIRVEDIQAGCVRFSAFAPDSQVPRAYQSVEIADPRALFTSQRFGDPGYGQLSDIAPAALARGGENGTEIGAFHRLLNPVKLDSLRAKVTEFLPFGLIPLFTTET
ncbi:hypothetical protein QLQ12_36605 [Actinoplanes sp. NEAU-A12]|uniref:Uncharacterized protein n=1 Tax=Actinoplanes sandaracinus TaxID=3045177 RepID=A0ABT6WWK1_9ACTN|nr:hypothetical protein [Actinoplanes sandaracinus]MDI6104128.1 hypothetical protein [Actinoplanes sandaracinus]